VCARVEEFIFLFFYDADLYKEILLMNASSENLLTAGKLMFVLCAHDAILKRDKLLISCLNLSMQMQEIDCV
jgi:hypothetical protein